MRPAASIVAVAILLLSPAQAAEAPQRRSAPVFQIPERWLGHGSAEDRLLAGLVPLPDGRYATHVIAWHGFTDEGPFARALRDDWIVYLDEKGAPVGEFQVPKMKADEPAAVLALGDLSILFAQNWKNYICLARVSRRGALLWQNCSDSGLVSELPEAARASDGGFALVDTIYSECQVTRLDDRGRILWMQKFGDQRTCAPQRIVGLAEGGFLVVAETSTVTRDEEKGPFELVVRLDGGGRKLWERKLDAFFPRMAALPDGSIVILAYWKVAHYDPAIWTAFRLDPDGRELWRRDSTSFVLAPLPLPEPEDLLALPNGEFLIVLRSPTEERFDGEHFVARVNSDGNVLWLRTVHGDDRPPRRFTDVGIEAVVPAGNVLFRTSEMDPENAGQVKNFWRALPLD